MSKGIDPSIYDFAKELADKSDLPLPPTEAEVQTLAVAFQRAYEGWATDVEQTALDAAKTTDGYGHGV